MNDFRLETVGDLLDKLAKRLSRATPREKRLAVIDEIARLHGFTLSDLLGPSRQRAVCAARFAAIAEVRRAFGDSYQKIGRLFGRHHTTVLNAVRAASRRSV